MDDSQKRELELLRLGADLERGRKQSEEFERNVNWILVLAPILTVIGTLAGYTTLSFSKALIAYAITGASAIAFLFAAWVKWR